MPIPADAKLAPISSFSPTSKGLKYGSVGSRPSSKPACNFIYEKSNTMVMHANDIYTYIETLSADEQVYNVVDLILPD